MVGITDKTTMSTSTSVYAQIVERIISEQESIIGPIVLEQAESIKGLKVNWQKRDITFHGKEAQVIEELIEKYRDFFGQVSVEVCKHAVRQLVAQLPDNERPMLLR